MDSPRRRARTPHRLHRRRGLVEDRIGVDEHSARERHDVRREGTLAGFRRHAVPARFRADGDARPNRRRESRRHFGKERLHARTAAGAGDPALRIDDELPRRADHRPAAAAKGAWPSDSSPGWQRNAPSRSPHAPIQTVRRLPRRRRDNALKGRSPALRRRGVAARRRATRRRPGDDRRRRRAAFANAPRSAQRYGASRSSGKWSPNRAPA